MRTTKTSRQVKKTVFLLAIAIAVGACTGRQATSTEGGHADSDSVARQPSIEELTLPDTSYASANAIFYRIDVQDSLPALLANYDDPYEEAGSVLTFRKNLRRNADYGGRVAGTPTAIEVTWRFDTERNLTQTRFGVWEGGSGWTGQPLYKDGTIIVGSLCGKVYFIDYNTGKAKAEPLDAGNVVKGTVSMDPELRNLYVGQGVPLSSDRPFGCQVFDLDKHQRTCFFGPDKQAWRGWGAFDSSPIVAGGYLFWPGENGSLYKFRRQQGRIEPVSVLRYRVGGMAPGIESSLCAYRNYGFFSDNRGNVICVNLNTMRPVWHFDNHDDSDGTIVCREEQGKPYLYTACEVDKQGDSGTCHFVKLDALTGTMVWERNIACQRFILPEKTLDGGMYATPLLGSGDCEGMVFANICRNKASQHRGELTAISTADGSICYTVGYDMFAWSSPIAFLNEENEMFVFTGDAAGNVYLIRGKTGEVLCKQHVANNFESSPIAIGNTAVVGSRGNGIYKLTIK